MVSILRSNPKSSPTPAATPGHRKKRRPNLQNWEKTAIVQGILRGEKRDALAAEFGIFPSGISMLIKRDPALHALRGTRGGSYKKRLNKRDWLFV